MAKQQLTKLESEALLQEFLKKFPMEKLGKLKKEEYANLKNEEPFTWWVESKLQDLGSIWGGSSFKFGFYRRRSQEEKVSDAELSYSENYAWVSKLGATEDEAYEKVRMALTQVAEAAFSGELEKIDANTAFWPIFKWKVAFLYQNPAKRQIVPVYKQSFLMAYLGEKDRSVPVSSLYRRIAQKVDMANVFESAKLIWQEAKRLLGQTDSNLVETGPSEILTSEKPALNVILYGPPGTGKTYRTIDKAVRVLDLDFYKKHATDRKALKEKYDELQAQGKVKFVTFHQSYGYEDFIEGLKAQTDEAGHIRYQIEPGTFKMLCEDAAARQVAGIEGAFKLKDQTVWKLSLGNTYNEDEDLFGECIADGKVLLGWGGNLDFSKDRDKAAIKAKFKASYPDLSQFAGTAVDQFINWMKKGDLVIVTEGNLRFRAIGEIIGDYEYEIRKDGLEFCQKRKVRWLRVYEPSLHYEQVSKARFSQMTIYQPRKIDREKLAKLLSEEKAGPKAAANQARVLIIDEINRGNISRIFGEVITLIEDGKRQGQSEALSVVLPYSKDAFSIPLNVYLIGTMNTADRSLTSLDVALRRRFEFEEIPPEPFVLDGIDVAGIAVDELLSALNDRIEQVLDRDHRIGHAYFLTLRDRPTMAELARIFEKKVLPLLREYFFDDEERLRYVLGEADRGGEDCFYLPLQNFGTGPSTRQRWRQNREALTSPRAYLKIMDKS